jgi:hypothetical protein
MFMHIRCQVVRTGNQASFRPRGGRNAEVLLSLAVGLRGAQGIAAIACDTDGIDGSEAMPAHGSTNPKSLPATGPGSLITCFATMPIPISNDMTC